MRGEIHGCIESPDLVDSGPFIWGMMIYDFLEVSDAVIADPNTPDQALPFSLQSDFPRLLSHLCAANGGVQQVQVDVSVNDINNEFCQG